VLVLDDDEAMRRTLEVFLQREGFAPVAATLGDLADGRLPRGRYACIVLDLRADAKSRVSLLYARLPGTPVIGMTAVPQGLHGKGLETLGLAGVLSKPFDLEELVALLEREVASSGEPAKVSEQERRKRWSL
jgi:DNA-binding NtrC family response regulator